MPWNYRVVKIVDDNRHLPEPEIYCEIRDVYYDENKDTVDIGSKPSFPHGEDIESLKWSLERMLECLNKPVIDYNAGEEIQELN